LFGQRIIGKGWGIGRKSERKEAKGRARKGKEGKDESKHCL